ncbi:hypothetical protein [Mobilicoccus pelagius]|uniref:Uncharacterized protein n=1 Tax=Mobilicoccus pelagius NBRC 104925 TaxID=1089455 RepID=H5UVC8_9MICO|nr:hypothetical protein [Mobilicoccus pelagius]GAB49686.1 hypothetical protein MOPEL_132_00530 [Mobilicoccus pelagius NBRC 104925]
MTRTIGVVAVAEPLESFPPYVCEMASTVFVGAADAVPWGTASGTV